MIFNLVNDILIILPEVFLSISILCFLLYFSILNGTSLDVINKHVVLRQPIFLSTLLVLFFYILLLLNTSSGKEILFFNSLCYDDSVFFSKIFLSIYFFFIVIFFNFYIKNNNLHAFEYYFLALLSFIGVLLIIQSYSFLSFYLALELQSLGLYVIASYQKKSAFSTEAGLKYFIIGALASGFFLFGVSLIYGSLGTVNFLEIHQILFVQNSDFYFLPILGLLFIISSLFFKLGLAPWHFWVPDVYEGSPISSTLFFAVIPKLSIVLGIIRILYDCFFCLNEEWSVFTLVIGSLSLLIGSFGALFQKKIKRFLVFSTITHIGFMLLAISTVNFFSIQSVFFYLFIYFFIAFVSWLLLGLIKTSISSKNSVRYLVDLENVFSFYPALGFTWCLFIFSIAGIPPLPGFYTKIFVFLSVIFNNWFFLSFFILIIAVISSFYYLRLIKFIFFQKEVSKLTLKPALFFDCNPFFSFVISFFFFFLLTIVLQPGFFIPFFSQIALSIFF